MTERLEQAYFASDYETWMSYWKQARVSSVYYKTPNFEEPDNPLQIRFREIPEGEDVDKPHPTIEVQIIETQKETFCVRALLDALPEDSVYKTFSLIEKHSSDYHAAITKRETDFEEWLEYKRNGNLKIETIDDTKPITWESIRNASTEELFQTKLEIFESPPVQDSENKEYRANIRKSSSIIEAMYWYYLIVNNVESSAVPVEKIPEDINALLDDTPSESILNGNYRFLKEKKFKIVKTKKLEAKLEKQII